ncbi:hypothetical protein PHO31112_01199 [Pandoraea horticolens]|uniref:Glycoside hydrolase n=1 Tax=Pandoraea horticolens TaxID=2508298 RepID=A0A5E4T4E3_9BURK|nr:hypothetical protein [Pandoraea horticolens]VVD82807.1 hypothetical protein PHO31112_01199 [Pandoraea horticolens]
MKYGKMMPSGLLALTLMLCSYTAGAVENYIYTSAGDFDSVKTLLNRPDISGAQIVYPWRMLEKSKGVYDFSPIEKDLAHLQSLHKRLFIQLQDRFFSIDARRIPQYLLEDPVYGGGLVKQGDASGETGWASKQWNPHLRERYQALLKALAEHFDGRIRGINLPETAIDVADRKDHGDFTCDGYFQATIDNMAYARKVFRQSAVVQYVNFWPCEWNNSHRYMERTFEFAAAHHIGLGGPDVLPYKPGQMHNAYPFFNRYKGRLDLVAMAVQEPDLNYRDPRTGKRAGKAEQTDFAVNYLGANIIFWATSAPGFREGRKK